LQSEVGPFVFCRFPLLQVFQGEAKPPNALLLVPYAGLLTLLKHGTDAEIKKGAALTTYLEEDIPAPSTASN
jgi:hypothetical protein